MSAVLIKLLVFSIVLQFSHCDWLSEWLSPVQEKIKGLPVVGGKGHPEPRGRPAAQHTAAILTHVTGDNLHQVLDSTLRNAKTFANILKEYTKGFNTREILLKDAIASGRQGASIVKVSTSLYQPRTYIVRDGRWALCDGVAQAPARLGDAAKTIYQSTYSSPKCIGREVPSQPDPCVFHSLVKYDVVPDQKAPEYLEENYLCLKPNVNSTVEHYMSVPKRIVNETCTNGVSRTVNEHLSECGLRAMTEYTFYPQRGAALPLEYCPAGACTLLTAWHVARDLVDRFEFLRNEEGFKKSFLDTLY